MGYDPKLCRELFFRIRTTSHITLKAILVYFVLIDVPDVFWFSEFLESCFVFFVNNLQVLYVNPGCNRIISGLKSSLANKNLLIILFTFIHLEQNITQKWYLAQRNYVPLLAQQCVCLLLLDKCWYYAIAHFTLWRKNYFLFLFFEALPYPFYYFCLLKENFTLIYEIWLLLINYNFL